MENCKSTKSQIKTKSSPPITLFNSRSQVKVLSSFYSLIKLLIIICGLHLAMVKGRIFLKYHKCNSLPSSSSPFASLMEIEEKYPVTLHYYPFKSSQEFFIFMVPTSWDKTTLLILGSGFRWS